MRRLSGKQVGTAIGAIILVGLSIVLAWVVIKPVPTKEKVVEKVITQVVEKEPPPTASPTRTVFILKATGTPELTPTPTSTVTPVGAERFLELVAEGKKFYQGYSEDGDIKTLNNAKRKFIEAYKIADLNPQLLDGNPETYSLYKEVVLTLIDILSQVGINALAQHDISSDLTEEFEILAKFGKSQLDQTIISGLAMEEFRRMRSYFDQIENPPKEEPTQAPTSTTAPTVEEPPTPSLDIPAGAKWRTAALTAPEVCLIYQNSKTLPNCTGIMGGDPEVIPARPELIDHPDCKCGKNPKLQTEDGS